MIIYSLYVDWKYFSLGLANEIAEGDYLLKTESIKLSDWHPITVELSSNGQSRMGDFISVGGRLGCNANTSKTLTENFPNEVSFLPVICSAGDFYILRVTKTIDCLDTQISDFEHFPSGNIRRITKYVFKPEMLQNNHIFHIPQRPVSPLFATDSFKKFIEDHQMTGLELTKLWEG